MPVEIEVTDNIDKIIQSVNAEKEKVELATISALNKTALWVSAQAIKRVSQEKKIPQKAIRKKIKIRKASKISLKSVISLDRSQWIGVAKLGSIKQTAIGARVAGRGIYKGAFIAVMKSGHVGIFKRRDVKSLPIDEIKINSQAWKTIKEIVKNNVELAFEMYFLEQLRKKK